MVHSLITLYSPNETEFKTNGLGSLNEAKSCIVVEEANASFELELVYPIFGRHYKEITNRSIIFAKPNPTDPPQAFRVYEISKPINGLVTFYAAHISYDLSGYPVGPFTAESCAGALTGLKDNAVVEHPFEFWTDKEVTSSFGVIAPVPTRSALGGVEGSILDIFGGEYKFDNFTVKLYTHRGLDRGVTIRYGKNLTDLEQEENFSKVYTAVYPYFLNQDDGSLITLPEKYISTEGSHDFTNILPIDFSTDFMEPPTEEQLRSRANAYIKNNDIGKPKVSLTVSFAQLELTEEYKNLALLERVELFDTVTVEFPELGVSSKAKVNQTTYDVLTGRYRSVTIGEVRADISSTIISQDENLSQAIGQERSSFNYRVGKATEWITNGRGYMVAVKDEVGNWMELCSLDKPDINTATDVWRWNNGGFGHSSNGYEGPYDTAITQDGHILANFIDTGTLTANIIKAGILGDKKGLNYWDMETGEFKLSAASTTVGDQSLDSYVDGRTADSIDEFIEKTYDPKIAELQKQLDGQIESYYYDHEPTLDNEPAIQWTTDEERKKHEGDLFYYKTKSRGYRFFKDGSTWTWQMIQDTDIVLALQKAADAQDTADNKRRNFVTTPTPPYDVGDTWTQGSGGDILRCQTAKPKGGTYSRNDWVLASNYVDQGAIDDSIDTYDNLLNQLAVFNKLTNNGVNQGIYLSGGKIYINGEFIKSNSIAADAIVVSDLSAFGATIGGFTIGSKALYNGMPSLNSYVSSGVYVGTDGIALGGGSFKVTSAGYLTSTSASFQSVSISGSTFSGTLSNASGTFGGSLNYADGYFDGNLYGAGGSYNGSINSSGTFSGSLSNASGSFGGNLSSAGGSYTGSIYSSGTFTGTNTGKLTGTASGATLSSCTNIGYLSGNSGNNLYLAGPATLTGSPVQLANSSSGTTILSATSTTVTAKGQWNFNSIKVTEGQKNRVLNTGFYGNRCLAAYETPQATFADYGVAALDKTGVCYICIDPVFERTVQPFSIPTVFLTKYGEGDIWVEQVDHDTLIVRGTPGLKFSWETRYEQGHLECERLPVSEFDEFCLGTPDYQQQYLVYIGQNEIDYSEEAYDYLVNFQNNSIDYANEAYEYYINFERSLVQ